MDHGRKQQEQEDTQIGIRCQRQLFRGYKHQGGGKEDPTDTPGDLIVPQQSIHDLEDRPVEGPVLTEHEDPLDRIGRAKVRQQLYRHHKEGQEDDHRTLAPCLHTEERAGKQDKSHGLDRKGQPKNDQRERPPATQPQQQTQQKERQAERIHVSVKCELKDRQGTQRVEKNVLSRQCKRPEYAVQQEQRQTFRNEQQQLQSDGRATTQLPCAPEDPLSKRKIGRSVGWMVDPCRQIGRMEREQCIVRRRMRVGVDPRGLHPSVPEIAIDIVGADRLDRKECGTDRDPCADEHEHNVRPQRPALYQHCQSNVENRGSDEADAVHGDGRS